MKIYSNRSLRVAALQAVGLNTAWDTTSPSIDRVRDMVDMLGALQIDTINVIQRSHYLTLWSRLGNYDTSIIDKLTGDPEVRAFFEGWYHCACYIPLSEYRYEMVRQLELRSNGHHWYSEWSSDPRNRQVMADVLEKIRATGEVRSASLDGKGTPFATWWNWRPEKMALEHLWTFGELMIRRRENFRKVYDLTERVLPAWVDTTLPTPQERDEHRILEGMRRFGVCQPRMAGDYSQAQRGKVGPIVKKLVKEGQLIEIIGETMLGEQPLLVHPEVLPILDAAEQGLVDARLTTFINPFDNLWWAKGRDELFWGFRQRLEAYVPTAKRVWGYYCLPILHKGNLIGRFDPKLDRKNRRMVIKNLIFEKGIHLAEQDLDQIALAFRSFLAFHKVDLFSFEHCNRPDELNRLVEILNNKS